MISPDLQPLTEAKEALQRLKAHLPATTLESLEYRLASWQRHVSRQQQSQVSMPQLVMRPGGLPPRPLNKHYFTVVRSYD